jgi:hypothetical protein
VHRTTVIPRHDLAFGLLRLLEGEVGRGENVGIDLGVQQRRAVEQGLGQLDRRQGLAPDELAGFRNRERVKIIR